jgi:hypothetical protein
MKIRLFIMISMILCVPCAIATEGRAQGGATRPPVPGKVPPEVALPKPSLIGTDAKTDPKQGGVSIPYLLPVASAKALTRGKGQCRYIVSSMPVGKPLKVELRVTNQKKFSCDRVELTSSYYPIKTLETITFKADQVEERNFMVRNIKCAVVH